MGRVLYVTSLLPYIILPAFVVRGVTLEGASEGIKFYLKPDWTVLNKPRIWGDAASQVRVAMMFKFNYKVINLDYITYHYAGLPLG